MTEQRKPNDLGKCTLGWKHLILMLSGYGRVQALLKLLSFKIHKGQSYYDRALLPANPSDHILWEHLPVQNHAIITWMLLVLSLRQENFTYWVFCSIQKDLRLICKPGNGVSMMPKTHQKKKKEGEEGEKEEEMRLLWVSFPTCAKNIYTKFLYHFRNHFGINN